MTSNAPVEMINLGGSGSGGAGVGASTSSGSAFDPATLFQETDETEEQPKVKGKLPKAKEVSVKELATRPTTEEIEQKQRLILKLNRYKCSRRFGEYLKDLGMSLEPKELLKMKVEQLEELLLKVQMTVNAKNNNNVFLEATMMGANFMERLTQNPKIKPQLDLEGLTQVLAQDEETQDAIESLGLEYGEICMMTPPMKLAYCLVSRSAGVIAMNKAKASYQARMLAQQVQSEESVDQLPLSTQNQGEKEEKNELNGLGLDSDEQQLAQQSVVKSDTESVAKVPRPLPKAIGTPILNLDVNEIEK